MRVSFQGIRAMAMLSRCLKLTLHFEKSSNCNINLFFSVDECDVTYLYFSIFRMHHSGILQVLVSILYLAVSFACNPHSGKAVNIDILLHN